MKNILTRALYDRRWFLLGWTLGLAVFAIILLVFFPSFKDGFGDELTRNLPAALQGFIGDITSFKEINAYIATQMFDIRAPMLLSIFAIILGASLTVNEEDKGLLRNLTALPVSRTRILLQKWLAVVIITTLALGGLLAGIVAGAGLVGELEQLDWSTLGQLLTMTWLVALALTSVPFFVGLASGKRGLTIGIASLVAIASFILTTFARNVDWLKDPERASLLHYYQPDTLYRQGFDATNIAVLAGVIIALFIIGVVNFRRRDIS